MRLPLFFKIATCLFLFLAVLVPSATRAQNKADQASLDQKIRQFLADNRSDWRDMNVPYQDGQVLHDLIVENNYSSALEIGTSTGHSTVWIAWALSKTGGKLITLEIDESRHKTALSNLEKAGLSHIVDARLTDAHEEVKLLDGPFDFVFSDADKGWYTQYFKDLDPKLTVGGCFTAHNVLNNFGGSKVFLDYVRSLDNYETSIDRSSRSGISISYKRSQ
jgi:caffeoyl-CoA O-methyltransferase